MKIKIVNGTVEGNDGTFVSIAHGVECDFDINGLKIIGDNMKGFDFREPTSLIERLGLNPKQKTQTELIDLIIQLKDKNFQESEEIVKKNGFFRKIEPHY